MATRTTKSNRARTTKKTVAASAKPAARSAVNKARALGRTVSAKVQETTPRARKVAAAAAGLAVAAIAARLVTRKHKKRGFFGK